MRRDRQLELPRPVVWGGRRKGAGRKRGERALVLHRRRPEHKARYPVHVTLRALPDVGSLRAWRAFHAAEGAIARASRSGFRVVHYSVQGDHVHAIVEAPDKRTLAAGVQGLMIRVARAINRTHGRAGRVWADRYHGRELRTPREVRNAIAYVLLNARKHGRSVAEIDPCSSARWFDGWRDRPDLIIDLASDPPGVAWPRTWLLAVGWRRHGMLRASDARQAHEPVGAEPARRRPQRHTDAPHRVATD